LLVVNKMNHTYVFSVLNDPVSEPQQPADEAETVRKRETSVTSNKDALLFSQKDDLGALKLEAKMAPLVSGTESHPIFSTTPVSPKTEGRARYASFLMPTDQFPIVPPQEVSSAEHQPPKDNASTIPCTENDFTVQKSDDANEKGRQNDASDVTSADMTAGDSTKENEVRPGKAPSFIVTDDTSIHSMSDMEDAPSGSSATPHVDNADAGDSNFSGQQEAESRGSEAAHVADSVSSDDDAIFINYAKELLSKLANEHQPANQTGTTGNSEPLKNCGYCHAEIELPDCQCDNCRNGRSCENYHGVQCHGACKQWFHKMCVDSVEQQLAVSTTSDGENASTESAEGLETDTVTSIGLVYYCLPCLESYEAYGDKPFILCSVADQAMRLGIYLGIADLEAFDTDHDAQLRASEKVNSHIVEMEKLLSHDHMQQFLDRDPVHSIAQWHQLDQNDPEMRRRRATHERRLEILLAMLASKKNDCKCAVMHAAEGKSEESLSAPVLDRIVDAISQNAVRADSSATRLEPIEVDQHAKSEATLIEGPTEAEQHPESQTTLIEGKSPAEIPAQLADQPRQEMEATDEIATISCEGMKSDDPLVPTNGKSLVWTDVGLTLVSVYCLRIGSSLQFLTCVFVPCRKSAKRARSR
jgi:hypothetical protein